MRKARLGMTEISSTLQQSLGLNLNSYPSTCTQYGMPSGPEAVFLILESANSTSSSPLNLGGGCVSQSMTSGAGYQYKDP